MSRVVSLTCPRTTSSQGLDHRFWHSPQLSGDCKMKAVQQSWSHDTLCLQETLFLGQLNGISVMCASQAISLLCLSFHLQHQLEKGSSRP